MYVIDTRYMSEMEYDRKVKTKGCTIHHITVQIYILLTAYVGLGVGKGVVGASDGSNSGRCALHS